MACRDGKTGKIIAYLGILAVVLFFVFQIFQMISSAKQTTEHYKQNTETRIERVLRQSE